MKIRVAKSTNTFEGCRGRGVCGHAGPLDVAANTAATAPEQASAFAARRKAALKAAAKAAGRPVGAFLVSKVEDVSYLSGFTGDDSMLLVRDGWACLVTDGRYDEQAHKECPGLDVFVRTGAMSAAIAEVLKGKSVRSMAVQGDHLTLQWEQAIQKALPKVRLRAANDVVIALRQVKDDVEVAAIRKAIKAAQTAFLALLAQGKKAFVGRTERQVAAELDYRMRLAGADKASFDTIVGAGAHSSLPHYRPDGTVIRDNEPVLIDWGAFVGGYCSDLTRVVLVGKISPKLVEVYEVVRRAQKLGIAAVRAGIGCKAVDAAARKCIAKAGFGKEFVHGLGHGIGRQIHEMPGVSRLSKARLKAGMVVTVEPGIYLPGTGGVRIEDDVLVGDEGPVQLSSLPTAMAAMTLQ